MILLTVDEIIILHDKLIFVNTGQEFQKTSKKLLTINLKNGIVYEHSKE